MFPLRFPYRILCARAVEGDAVLDPFCGRGTTNYAARLLGLDSVGFDSNPVAAAIARAKLAQTSFSSVINALDSALESVTNPKEVPEGEFWSLAYHPSTLRDLCRVREALLQRSDSQRRIALRAVIMGALHGPTSKMTASYLSNQCPRTFAPKPRYAINFWRARGLKPEKVDIRNVVTVRAKRYYGSEASKKRGAVFCVDSRSPEAYGRIAGRHFDWVITSPPYYGMRTYIPDQWLRNWFVGGPSWADYSNRRQLEHSSPDVFANELKKVWKNAALYSRRGSHLVVRFGGINDRHADPIMVMKESLRNTGWDAVTITDAGHSSFGKRQVEHFGRGVKSAPRQEFDVWAVRSETTPQAIGVSISK